MIDATNLWRIFERLVTKVKPHLSILSHTITTTTTTIIIIGSISIIIRGAPIMLWPIISAK